MALSNEMKRLLERATLGAIVGAGIATGNGRGAGAQFVATALQRAMTNPRAIEYVARRLAAADPRGDPWSDLAAEEKHDFRKQARVALDAVLTLMQHAVSGG